MRSSNRINNAKLSLLWKEQVKHKGLNQATIAASIEINQSQVSRILSGNFCRPSKNVNALCTLLDVKMLQEQGTLSLEDYPELSNCLAGVLDGTRKRERVIVRLIRSAQSLS